MLNKTLSNELKQVKRDSRKLFELRDDLRVKLKNIIDITDNLRHVNKNVREVVGPDPEESKSSLIRNIGLSLLSLPIDPTQITTATGATLIIISKVVEKVERKTYGLKYVVTSYNKLLFKIREILI